MRVQRPGILMAVWIAGISLLVGVIMLIIVWIHVSDTVSANQHRSDMRWCTLLHQIQYPRAGTSGAKFNGALTALEQEFRCGP